MTGPQQSYEGGVLAAALDDDMSAVADLVQGLLPLERATLAAACDRVAEVCQRLANSPVIEPPTIQGAECAISEDRRDWCTTHEQHRMWCP